MAEVANSPVTENNPEDVQPVDNNTTSEEKVENTGNAGENAQENSATEKPLSTSQETKKETENAALPNKSEPSAKYSVHKTNFEKDMIYLYQFSRTPLLPSLSPYCLKVETWLRLAGLKYEVSKTYKCTKNVHQHLVAMLIFLIYLLCFCTNAQNNVHISSKISSICFLSRFQVLGIYI